MFKKLLGTISVFMDDWSYLIISTLGLTIRILTIVIAWSAGGIVGAALTLCLPLISELYWFFIILKVAGNINNHYCLLMLGYILTIVITMAVAPFAVFVEDNES